MTQQELQKQAQPYFETRPEATEIIATDDGAFFWPEQKQFARIHADKAGSQLHTITRPVKKGKTKVSEDGKLIEPSQTPDAQPPAPIAPTAPKKGKKK